MFNHGTISCTRRFLYPIADNPTPLPSFHNVLIQVGFDRFDNFMTKQACACLMLPWVCEQVACILVQCTIYVEMLWINIYYLGSGFTDKILKCCINYLCFGPKTCAQGINHGTISCTRRYPMNIADNPIPFTIYVGKLWINIYY